MHTLEITKTVEGEGAPTFPSPAIGVVGRDRDTEEARLHAVFPVEDSAFASYVADLLAKGVDILATEEITPEKTVELCNKDWSARVLFLSGVEIVPVDEENNMHTAIYSETVPDEQRGLPSLSLPLNQR
ncbi:hypothetical protein KY385_01655 [Candidatus Parcubacteria bacterium]|nr:hypothetical protein [Candidatus Parcubacteria bacterium]